MIELKEVRVGNYVLHPVIGRCKIIELKNDDDMLSHLSPIPLTEDILLKCGFEKETYLPNGYFRNNPIEKFKLGYFYILNTDILNGEYGIGLHEVWDGISLNIKSLHQLQNLYFALTGKELEINL